VKKTGAIDLSDFILGPQFIPGMKARPQDEASAVLQVLLGHEPTRTIWNCEVN
jgi:hypothetical protein